MGRMGCHESFCTVARCYDFFGAVLLLFGGNGKDGNPMGVVQWEERI